MYDHSLSWLGSGTSLKSGWVKLVLWAQISPLNETMWSYNCQVISMNCMYNVFENKNLTVYH